MAKKAKGSNLIGAWAFLIGVLIAVIIPIVSSGPLKEWIAITLLVIGIIVGLLNVTSEEGHEFMTSGIVLIIASAFGMGTVSTIPVLVRILSALLLIFVPATILVEIRNVFSVAHK